MVVEQFLTDTAREADLVLPAKTLFELPPSGSLRSAQARSCSSGVVSALSLHAHTHVRRSSTVATNPPDACGTVQSIRTAGANPPSVQV